MLGIEEIMKVLPHRYPFLLVDRILEIERGKRIVGIKNVTINEPFFQGHFPGHPIMPGVLIIEAMAQVGGMLLMGAVDDPETKVVYFMSLDNVKWRRPVKPGDQLRFELEVVQVRGTMCKMQRRREGGRRGRCRGGDGARWCATDDDAHPSDRASSRRAPSSAPTSRSARSRSSARAATIGDGCVIARARDARAQRAASAPSVKVGIGTRARRRPAGSQVQGRGHDGRDRRRHDDPRVRDDQPRHRAVVQDDGRARAASSCRTSTSRTTATSATA